MDFENLQTSIKGNDMNEITIFKHNFIKNRQPFLKRLQEYLNTASIFFIFYFWKYYGKFDKVFLQQMF